jgi:hypothetical protein
MSSGQKYPAGHLSALVKLALHARVHARFSPPRPTPLSPSNPLFLAHILSVSRRTPTSPPRARMRAYLVHAPPLMDAVLLLHV